MEEWLTNIFVNRKKEPKRKVVMYRCCDYNGWVDSIFHCGNEDCHQCNRYFGQLHKWIQEEYLDKYVSDDKDFAIEHVNYADMNLGKPFKIAVDPPDNKPSEKLLKIIDEHKKDSESP